MPNERQIDKWNGDTARRWLAERERHAAVREPLLPHLLAQVRAGDRVLDVGCGCGDVAVALAGTAAEVVGLDVSEPLLAVAARAPGVRYERGDAQVHPLPPGYFDVVVSSFGVMFFEDPVAAFRNLRGTLRAGGRLAFLCWQGALVNEVFAIPLRACERYGVHTGAVTADPFADPGWIAGTLTAAGFTGAQVRGIREPVRLGADAGDVLAYANRTSMIRDLLAGSADRDRILAATAADLAARERPGGLWVDAAAFLVTATVE
ncbi:methyltransferase [Actinoplanes ianthinogenes]|uniref:Methyltransferase n=1 Tax=Actinoplanes ianthinogenes TaxID=122358 RepID=A0ABM7LKS5_9ACTN|nr:class I SAM-dependent methyltransferase [Actinoplanes ianthinogenes]BCJ39773.1 methyltransferase [Actinoplanes ianthinogenes]GGR60025.1 methyltransferase [Actinoplanes ianthinogenes]